MAVTAAVGVCVAGGVLLRAEVPASLAAIAETVPSEAISISNEVAASRIPVTFHRRVEGSYR